MRIAPKRQGDDPGPRGQAESHGDGAATVAHPTEGKAHEDHGQRSHGHEVAPEVAHGTRPVVGGGHGRVVDRGRGQGHEERRALAHREDEASDRQQVDRRVRQNAVPSVEEQAQEPLPQPGRGDARGAPGEEQRVGPRAARDREVVEGEQECPRDLRREKRHERAPRRPLPGEPHERREGEHAPHRQELLVEPRQRQKLEPHDERALRRPRGLEGDRAEEQGQQQRTHHLGVELEEIKEERWGQGEAGRHGGREAGGACRVPQQEKQGRDADSIK